MAVVTHSGSVFSALLHNDRRLRFNLVVSAGNELVTSAAAYLDHAVELPTTRVVALFLETVREPAAFRAALAKAAARSIPVVALKVGRAQAARAMVAAHSGALAGEDGAYQALFDAYGVAQVPPSTSWPTPASSSPAAAPIPARWPPSATPAANGPTCSTWPSSSGSAFADISEATRQRLAAVLEPGLPPTNPLDAWGTGNDADQIFATCIQALLEDPATAALALNLDLTTEPTPDTSYTGLAIAAAASTTKPVAVLSNLTSAADPTEAATLRAAGVPVLEGTATGLAALGHLFAYRDFLARADGAMTPGEGLWTTRHPRHPGRLRSPTGGPGPGPLGSRASRRGSGSSRARDRWRARLGEHAQTRRGRALDEAEGLALLATGGCRWWRPRWRPAWRRRWPRAGGLGGRWC